MANSYTIGLSQFRNFVFRMRKLFVKQLAWSSRIERMNMIQSITFSRSASKQATSFGLDTTPRLLEHRWMWSSNHIWNWHFCLWKLFIRAQK